MQHFDLIFAATVLLLKISSGWGKDDVKSPVLVI